MNLSVLPEVLGVITHFGHMVAVLSRMLFCGPSDNFSLVAPKAEALDRLYNYNLDL